MNGESVPAEKKLDVIFYPYMEGGPPDEFYKATSKPGGLFHVSGKTGKGIPPGKYRISVTGAKTRENQQSIDPKIGNYASPIVREITSDDELLIDLAKPGG